MKVSAIPGSGPKRWLLYLISTLVAVLLLCITLISIGIVRTANVQQIQRADAIVVFGAAEYAGRPSPVFRARLDHAFTLFQQGIAPVVITTGGAAHDPSLTEGGVGRDYLIAAALLNAISSPKPRELIPPTLRKGWE